MLLPLLDASDELLARDILKAYGMLVKEKGENVYWRYLLHGRELSCIQAYRNIKKYHIFYGAGVLYHTYVEQMDKELGKYLLNLLLREPSWKGLPYFIIKQIYIRISILLNLNSSFDNVAMDKIFIYTVNNDKIIGGNAKLTR